MVLDPEETGFQQIMKSKHMADLSNTVKVKFERKHTGSSIWLDIRCPSDPWDKEIAAVYIWFRYAGAVDGTGPGADWAPIAWKEEKAYD